MHQFLNSSNSSSFPQILTKYPTIGRRGLDFNSTNQSCTNILASPQVLKRALLSPLRFLLLVLEQLRYQFHRAKRSLPNSPQLLKSRALAAQRVPDGHKNNADAPRSEGSCLSSKRA
jgi:hypothetical protein